MEVSFKDDESQIIPIFLYNLYTFTMEINFKRTKNMYFDNFSGKYFSNLNNIV